MFDKRTTICYLIVRLQIVILEENYGSTSFRFRIGIDEDYLGKWRQSPLCSNFRWLNQQWLQMAEKYYYYFAISFSR